MKVLYKTEATSTGGREGHSRSADGVLDVTLTTPKELGGQGSTGTNPEQLFAAGYSACFLGALKFVAGKEKIHISPETSITVPGVERSVAEDLVAKAHIVCPYSEATRGNIPVTLTVA